MSPAPRKSCAASPLILALYRAQATPKAVKDCLFSKDLYCNRIGSSTGVRSGGRTKRTEDVRTKEVNDGRKTDQESGGRNLSAFIIY